MEPNTLIIILSSLNITSIWMHELDACYHKEWRMLTFLRKFKEDIQYQIFLLAHIPLLLFSIYYLWAVFLGNNFLLWIIWNVLSITHLGMHLHAKNTSVNVFKSSLSFIFIYAAAITSFLDLLLFKYY